MSEGSMKHTFPVSSPARLELDNLRGSVEVRCGEEGLIQVTAVKQTDSGDAPRTKIEMNQSSDGTVVVRTRFPEAGWNWLFGSLPCKVNYVVRAPHACALKLRGVANTLEVQGFEGEFFIDAVSGEVSLRDLTGAIRIRTVSGEVCGERLSGSLELNTVSGDVNLKESNLRSVRSYTVSGDVSLVSALGEGPYTFDSVSGDVRLTVPPATRCTADLASFSGCLSTVFPVSGYFHNPGLHTVMIQGGGVKVSLKSVSGDLLLESSGPIPAVTDRKSTPAFETRRAVLEDLERGELTVEDALIRLRG